MPFWGRAIGLGSVLGSILGSLWGRFGVVLGPFKVPMWTKIEHKNIMCGALPCNHVMRRGAENRRSCV